MPCSWKTSPLLRDLRLAYPHRHLENGDIDLYPEYTGTGLISVLQMDPLTDPETVYNTVKDEHKKQLDLVWLDKSEAADGQGLVIRTEAAKRLDIKTISDLQAHAGELRRPARASSTSGPTACPRWKPSTAPPTGRTTPSYDEGLKYQVLANDEMDVTPPTPPRRSSPMTPSPCWRTISTCGRPITWPRCSRRGPGRASPDRGGPQARERRPHHPGAHPPERPGGHRQGGVRGRGPRLFREYRVAIR